MSMTNPSGVLALYPYEDTFTQAMSRLLQTQGFDRAVPYAPASYHGLMDVAHRQYGDSPVRWWALGGGLLGCGIGFFMPLLMDFDWPLVVGGKTAGLNSSFVFVIFMFEFFILLGALATILAMLWFWEITKIAMEFLTDLGQS